MSIIDSDDKPIIISSASARGGSDPEHGKAGQTLLPMLIVGLVLIVAGVALVWLLV